LYLVLVGGLRGWGGVAGGGGGGGYNQTKKIV